MFSAHTYTHGGVCLFTVGVREPACVPSVLSALRDMFWSLPLGIRGLRVRDVA